MNTAATAIADLMGHVQPAFSKVEKRPRIEEEEPVESEIREAFLGCLLPVFPGDALIVFSDDILLYMMRLDPETGAVTFFAMHFIEAISRTRCRQCG